MSNENEWEEIPTETDSDWEEVTPNDAPELSAPELGKTAAGGILGYGTGKVVGNFGEKASEKLIDPLAEDLAYRGAGGYSGVKPAVELNEAMVNKNAGKLSKGITNLAEGGAFDDGVNPRSVGREILNKDLLGPFGLGKKVTNSTNAKANLLNTSKPTNEILNSIEEYPVHQSPIFSRMKELLGYDDLSNTVEDDVKIKNKVDVLNDKSFDGIETPLKAEEVKRKLQQGADFNDPERTIKNAMNVAQSTARKEAVENAVLNSLGPEKLEEFKRLKAQSGSAGVASDMLAEVYKKSQKPLQYNGLIGTALDYIGERGAGIAAKGLDTVSSGIKSGAKAIAPGLGTLIGLTAGASAADEQTDSADFIPVLDQATAAGSSFDDKEAKGYVKARQNYDKSPAALGRAEYLRNTIQTTPESFKNGYAYKQAEQELNKLTDGSKALKKANPEQLMDLSQSFKDIKGADKFVAPLENAAQADSEEERKARLFGLYQQPAFRQLLNKKNQN